MSLNGYTQNSIENPEKELLQIKREPISLNIELPEPIEIKKDNIIYYAWDLKGYGTILQLFNAYTLWADNYINESEQEALWQIRLDICERDKVLEKQNFNLAIENRDNLYKSFLQNEKDAKKEETKQAIKTIAIATGTGIVGVAAGILIGFFAAK